MQNFHYLGKNFAKDAYKSGRSRLKVRFKSDKHVWTPKEKELISKYRKGLIWKDI